MKKKLVLMTSALMAITLLAGCGQKSHTHEWGEVTYTWAPDNSTCTAVRVCKTDESHKEEETVNSVYTVETAPLCEVEGEGKYVATFVNTAFTFQTKTVTLEALGHLWGTPTYTWSSDNTQCTATRVCENDPSHTESETVDSVYTVITPETMIADGSAKYTATFTKSYFEVQTKEITIPMDKFAKKPHLSEDNKTLTYGLYPQTNVNDESLVASLNKLTTPESNGWYLCNDEYYAKVSATPNNSSYKFDNGTTIVSGTIYWFKCEPITWNVLSNNDGEYYILSSVLLDAHCYYNSSSNRTIDDKTIYANNYEYSDIRTWLNNDFYNSAFALGNTYIQTTTVDNGAATTDTTSNSYACNNTQDKVFLPSYKDYLNSSYGFSTSTGSTNTRYCKTTDWVRARGAYYSTSSSYLYNGYYWTRSPSSGGGSYYAWNVRDDGTLGIYDVSDTRFSVRPGLSIKIA